MVESALKLIKSSSYHVDSSFDHKVTTYIIILKIQVSPRQLLENPIFKPWKGPKSEENDPPPHCEKASYGYE